MPPVRRSSSRHDPRNRHRMSSLAGWAPLNACCPCRGVDEVNLWALLFVIGVRLLRNHSDEQKGYCAEDELEEESRLDLRKRQCRKREEEIQQTLCVSR